MTIVADWMLIVPQQQTIFEPGTKENSTNGGHGKAINLLEQDRPTKMVEWLISSLRIPYTFNMKVSNGSETTKAGTVVEIQAMLVLRVGGDIMFSEQQTLTLEGQTEIGKKSDAEYIANGIFGTDLQNPIKVPNGRTLTLELYCQNVSVEGGEWTGWSAVNGWLSSNSRGGIGVGESTTVIRSEGVIQYSSNKLSGHNVL